MLKTTVKIKGLKELQKLILFLDKITKKDKELSSYLCFKSLEALNKVIGVRLLPVTSGIEQNTNLEYLQEYIRNNEYEITNNGFKIFNNTTSYDYDYPFSIALAFEYGTGIVGENNPKENHWEYNVNKYNFGWHFTNSNGERQHTYGYEGMEIYRYLRIEIENNIEKWLDEYLRGKM